MKACRYCHAIMQSEYETNAHDTHRYKGFQHWLKCGAICDEDVTEKRGTRTVHMERWFNPETKTFEP